MNQTNAVSHRQNPANIIGADVINMTSTHVLDHMVEVRLLGDQSTMYRRVLETLTRIGVIPRDKPKTLVQNCHILHKQGRYYITHYKLMYCLDGGENRVTEHDIIRQSKIVRLLVDWGMVEVVDPKQIELPTERSNLGDLKIVPHADRDNWRLQAKYIMGQVLKGEAAYH